MVNPLSQSFQLNQFSILFQTVFLLDPKRMTHRHHSTPKHRMNIFVVYLLIYTGQITKKEISEL